MLATGRAKDEAKNTARGQTMRDSTVKIRILVFILSVMGSYTYLQHRSKEIS